MATNIVLNNCNNKGFGDPKQSTCDLKIGCDPPVENTGLKWKIGKIRKKYIKNIYYV